jgi:hypothetical protein
LGAIGITNCNYRRIDMARQLLWSLSGERCVSSPNNLIPEGG